MRIPKNRPPTHPGEILREDFLKPLGLTQEQLANELGVSFQRINGIVNGRRSVRAETALLLAGYLGTTATFWMNAQVTYDLYAVRRKLGDRRLAALIS